MKEKIIFFGDSIIKYNTKKKNYNWSQEFIKRINKSKKKKYNFKTYSFTGLNSKQAVKKIDKILHNLKFIKFIFIQIGINDSWYFKSLKGKPNISEKDFKKNLSYIISKCKKKKIKHIIVLNYHKLLKERVEINNKTLNQNLKPYQKIIKDLCSNKKRKLLLIDIQKETRGISSSKICLKLPDGVHLNKIGTKIYASIILKKVQKIL